MLQRPSTKNDAKYKYLLDILHVGKIQKKLPQNPVIL